MQGSLQLLTLALTERCNLRCGYCFARSSSRRLDPELADAAVDWFMAQARDQAKPRLTFFGGEPFLEAGLMRRALERARLRAQPQQTVECSAPTNGLAFSPYARDLCQEFGLSLTVSIDGPAHSERRWLDGADSGPDLVARIPQLLPFATLARLTVTPTNVARLSHNIIEVARLGFPAILFNPAWDHVWDDAAVAIWRRELARIVGWVLDARAAGLRVPQMRNLADIEARLVLGRPRQLCGAGNLSMAAATDGTLVPCERLVFIEAGADCRLGHVSQGITEHATRDTFARVRASDLRPESGTCAKCPAKDGCTHYCPATGYLMTGDVRGVPSVICALIREEVEAVRLGLQGHRLPARTTSIPLQPNAWSRKLSKTKTLPDRQRLRPLPGFSGWTAAAVAASSSIGIVACGGQIASADDAGAKIDGVADATNSATDAPVDFDVDTASGDGMDVESEAAAIFADAYPAEAGDGQAYVTDAPAESADADSGQEQCGCCASCVR